MKSRWSVKYKRKINCNSPKGFSQKNYCKRQKRGGRYMDHMDFSSFLLLIESDLPQIKYLNQIASQYQSQATVTLNSGVRFEVTIWMDRDQVSIQFYQIGADDDIITRREEDQKNLSMNEFVQLFLGIEQIILDYFNKFPEIKSIKIHPEAIGKRSGVLDKRNRKDTGRDSQFDPNKANAYLQLFNYSKLKQMGYQVSQVGENIFIEKV